MIWVVKDYLSVFKEKKNLYKDFYQFSHFSLYMTQFDETIFR